MVTYMYNAFIGIDYSVVATIPPNARLFSGRPTFNIIQILRFHLFVIIEYSDKTHFDRKVHYDNCLGLLKGYMKDYEY